MECRSKKTEVQIHRRLPVRLLWASHLRDAASIQRAHKSVQTVPGGTLIYEDPPIPIKSPIVILIILGHCAAPTKVVSYYNKSRITCLRWTIFHSSYNIDIT